MTQTLVIDKSNADQHQGGWIGCGGFYVRDMTEIINDPTQPHCGHAHYIDHLGDFLGGGVLRVHWEDPDGTAGVIEMHEPCVVDIPKDRKHRFEVVSGRPRWRCLFAKAEADSLALDTKTNWTLEK